jgi:PAS domain S-box-containing protein
MSMGPRTRRGAAEHLDDAALAAIVDRSPEGIVVITLDRRYRYANPSACRILGCTLEELLASPDYLANFPEREHVALLARFEDQLSSRSGVWTSTIRRPDGTEREITWSNVAISIDGRPHGVAVFRDTTGTRDAGRAAAALGQAAAQLVGRRPLHEVLETLADDVIDTTRGAACVIGVADGGGALSRGGASGLTSTLHARLVGGGVSISDLPDADVVLEGRTAVVTDIESRWRSSLRPEIGDALAGLGWETGVHVPLSWGTKILGVMLVFLPREVSAPTAAELASYGALADQAAVAVINDRLMLEAGQASALRERARLARELHDSVSQTLFSMSLHARGAELALADLPEAGAIREDLEQLRELSRSALAEMRALLFELRPEALAEEGLVSAVEKQAAALVARRGLDVRVHGPRDRGIELRPETEEHLYRIVLEALNNTLKHAGATHATVAFAFPGEQLEVTVTDDGSGFDQGIARPGHLGLRTMRDRARAIGAQLEIRSGNGVQGTVVRVMLDRD